MEPGWDPVVLYRTIDVGSMERWHDGTMTIARWRNEDGAMVRRRDAVSRHRYRVIGPSLLHYIDVFARLAWKKWRQDHFVVFGCYDLSITYQASRMLLLNALFFWLHFIYNVCRLNFKKKSSVKESWTYIANQYEIFRSLLNDCRYGVKHYPINQSINQTINQSINQSIRVITFDMPHQWFFHYFSHGYFSLEKTRTFIWTNYSSKDALCKVLLKLA